MSPRDIRLHASVSWHLRDNLLEISSPILGKKLRIRPTQPEATNTLLHGLSGSGDSSITESVLKQDTDGSQSAIIQALESRGMVIARKESDRTFDQPLDTLEDRQARFFNSFETPESSGLDYIKALNSKRVAIFGLGGFGTWLVLLCDRIGIGTILGVDFDHVELSNLPRQVLFGRRHLGMKKVDACRDAILESGLGNNFIGIDSEIQSTADAKTLLKDVDFAFIPFGHTPARKINTHVSGYIAKACTEMGVPYIFVGANMVGPLWAPSHAASCYFCLLDALNGLDGIDPAHRSQLASKRAFAPPISASCSRAVWEAAGFLTGAYTPQTIGKVIGVDWIGPNPNFSIGGQPTARGCEVCNSQSR